MSSGPHPAVRGEGAPVANAAGRTLLVDDLPAALPAGEATSTRLGLTLVSFGFKYGQPPANHYFDVSFLKNPARQEGWTLFSEPGEEMRAWVLEQPAAVEFLERIVPLALFLARADDDARIALGCSAGRHRSAILTEELARRLRAEGLDIHVHHRERELS